MKTVTSILESSHISYIKLQPPEIKAGISLKCFFEENSELSRVNLRRRFVESVGSLSSASACAEQVHGGVVAYVNKGLTVSGVDGLITDKPNLFLTIIVADCLPIFLWDRHGRAIALLHAGWRGTTAQIAQNGVKQLVERFGIESKNINAILGPCICQRCYEVGPEVALNFDAAILQKGSGDRSHLNLRYANFIQLVEAGVSEDSIYVDERCTCCNEEMFFSYRRDGKDTGRMVAAIGIAPDYN